MKLGISPLLVEKQTLVAARKTMALAKSAALRGDLRLGVSRALTAVVQASVVAARTSRRSTKKYADDVIQTARELVMGIVVHQARLRGIA